MTLDTEEHETLHHIEKILVVRYWLFLGIIICLIVMSFGIYGNMTNVSRLEKKLGEQDVRSAQNRALIESSYQQQIIFQTTIAQIMDKMSKENPRLRVPRVPIKAPPDVSGSPTPDQLKSTDEELSRTKPKTMPTPKPEAHSKSKHKPTPSPTARFKWPWQSP